MKTLAPLLAAFLGAFAGLVVATYLLGDNPRGGMWQLGAAAVGAMMASAPFRWKHWR